MAAFLSNTSLFLNKLSKRHVASNNSRKEAEPVRVENIGIDELHDSMSATIIDIRDASELPETGMLPGSIAPLADGRADESNLVPVIQALDEVQQASVVVLVDADGGSGVAIAAANELAPLVHPTPVYVLAEGARGWAEKYVTECFLKSL